MALAPFALLLRIFRSFFKRPLTIHKVMQGSVVVSYIVLFFFVILLDQFTKKWALLFCKSLVKLTETLLCHVTINRGISWGLFSFTTTWCHWCLFVLIGLITILVGVYAFLRLKKGWSVYGEVLILAGSFSNLIDRWYYQGVIDFIMLNYNGWYWPTTFNCADVAIVCGVILMFLQAYRHNNALNTAINRSYREK